MNDTSLPSGSRLLIAAAALVVVMTGLRLAAPVLIMFALAAFLVTVSRPAVVFLQNRRVPSALAIAAVIMLTFAVLAAFISIATQSINDIRLAFPRYIARYEVMEAALLTWLQERNIEVPPALRLDTVSAERVLELATAALRGLAGFMSAALLVLVIAIFGMVEANALRQKFVVAFGGQVSGNLGRFAKIIDEVQHYLAIKTIVSLATGVFVGVWVWMVGLDFAVFWGLLAFILNFVPSIGSILAALPAMMLALVQLGPNGMLMTAVGYVVVNVLLGNVLEPTLLGRRLGLSPLVIILSVLFWGWLWGPIGFLLAVPLTMIARIMLENTEDYRWVAVLMAPLPERERLKRQRLQPPADQAAATARVPE